MSFHSRQSLSVNFFHVSLGLPAPGLPSICISHAVLIAPQDRSTCPNQRCKMRLRSSSLASSSLDLTVASSSGLIQLICLISDHGPIMALQALQVRLGQWPSLTGMEHGAPHIRAVYMATVLFERWQDVRTGSSSLNFFQAVISQPPPAESMSPR